MNAQIGKQPISDLTPPENDSNTGKIIVAGAALALAWAAWIVWAREGKEVPMSRAERRMAMRANPSRRTLKVYLDDERVAPSGWTQVRWPNEAIELLRTGKVKEISLDHDLGDDKRTGYDVLLWIEESTAMHGFVPPKIKIHSANPAGIIRMASAVRSIERFAKRANPDEGLIRRVRQMISFGLSKQEIVEAIGTKEYSRDDIYLAYHAAVLADKPRNNPKSPHVLAVPKPGYSAATSQRQVPGLFSKMKAKGFLRRNTKNIDIGGGQYTEGTDFLAKHGVKNTVFDPGWMNDSQLKVVERRINRHDFDTATVANVLNVIASPKVRSQVIMTAAAAIKPTGVAFFSTYEGDKTGIAKAPKKSQTLAANDPRRMWQENRKTETYVPEIKKHFHDVTRYGDMIVASSPYKQ